MTVAFQILSHAGLLVEGAGKRLVFDPWLVGSAYWRSWWNYPPVPAGMAESLRPDFICLTRIRWDRFHGPSLRKFPRETPILIPRMAARRMKEDLAGLGFANIAELPHGRSLELAPGLRLALHQTHPFTESAAVVECGGMTLFNANDARLPGAALDRILARHPRIDFVFRSPLSGGPHACFDFMDAPGRGREEAGSGLRDFAAFIAGTGARYAVPLAGNLCHLHRETFHLNHAIGTPPQAAAYCRALGAGGPEVKPMTIGDSWSSETGFALAQGPYFTDRDGSLADYAAAQAAALEKSYALEARTEASLAQVEGYFRGFIAALPGTVRRAFRGKQVTLVLSGRRTGRFWVDIHRGVVREVIGADDEANPLQIHTSAYIFRRCMALGLFTHLALGKRVLFRCKVADAKYLRLLNILFGMYECGMLPAWNMLKPRFLSCWAPRWREAIRIAGLLIRMARGRHVWDTPGPDRPRAPEPAIRRRRTLPALTRT